MYPMLTISDTSKQYFLTNNYTTVKYHLGGKLPEDVYMQATVRGGPMSLWLFSETERPGYYRLHSKEVGKSRALDVINDNGTNSRHVHLAPVGRYSGQYWRLDSWGDGTYKLTNSFAGTGKHLDVYSDILQPHLAAGNCTGQHWKLEEVQSLPSASPVLPPRPVLVVPIAAPATTSTSFSTSSFTPISASSLTRPSTSSTTLVSTPRSNSPSSTVSNIRNSVVPLASDIVRDLKLQTSFIDGATVHTHSTSDPSAGRRRVIVEEKWERQAKLGNGTFGTVWLEKCALGPKKGSMRAVKEIAREVAKPQTIDYGRELEAIAKFSHEKYVHCFVKSYGWWENIDNVFIVMEYLELGDLQKYLVKPFSEGSTRQITTQLIEGLAFMHENGFAHRDLKPAISDLSATSQINILVFHERPEWWVKISDFGISKRAEGDYHTSLRTKIGTESYAAPEQRGIFTLQDLQTATDETQAYTFAVDIWAVGVITYQLLTNEFPFPDPRGFFQYVTLGTAFPKTTLKRVNASPPCLDFIEKTMAASPSGRPNAQELVSSPWLTSDLVELTAATTSFEPQSIDTATAKWTTEFL